MPSALMRFSAIVHLFARKSAVSQLRIRVRTIVVTREPVVKHCDMLQDVVSRSYKPGRAQCMTFLESVSGETSNGYPCQSTTKYVA